MTLRKGIYYTPFEIKEKGNLPLKLLKIKIPILEEKVNRVLSGDEPAHILLLDYERVVKNIAYRIANLGGNIVYVNLGELYILIWGIENYKRKFLRRLQIAVNNAFNEKRVLTDDFELQNLQFIPYQLKISNNKEITLLKVVNLKKELKTPLEFIPGRYSGVPLMGITLFEDAVYFEMRVKLDKKNLEKIIEFVQKLSKLGVFVYFVPVIKNNFMIFRGTFTEPLPIIKHNLKSVVESFSEFLNVLDAELFMGSGYVVGGIMELESVTVPVLNVIIPPLKKEERLKIDNRILFEIDPHRGFLSHNIPFIGRLEELEVFESFVYEKRGLKKPVFINIFGVPGSGKTRFIEEISSLIGGMGEKVEIIKVNIPRSNSRDVYSALSLTAKSLGIESKNMEIHQLSNLISEKIKELTQSSVVFLIFEDIDTLGDDTVKFLSTILLASDVSGAYVITTSRKKLTLPYMDKDTSLYIQLGGLSEESLKYLILEVLGAFPSSELLRFVREKTQGIPLYVIELLFRLKAQGRLVQRGKYFDLEKPFAGDIYSLEDIIGEFYESFKGDGVKTLIDICAIYPEDIPVHILEGVYSKLAPRRDFEGLFKQLIESRLVDIRTHEDIFPGITIKFKNYLFKRVIVDKIDKSRLSRLRKILLNVLEKDKRIPEIVRYRVIADIAKSLGDEEKFVQYMWKYALEHNRVNSFDTAYKALVEIEEKGPELLNPFEFYSLFSSVAVHTGNYGKALEHFENSLKVADEKEKKSIYPIGAIIHAAMGKMEEARKYLDMINPDKYRDVDKGFVYNALGICYLREQRNEEAERSLVLAKEYLADKNSAFYVTVLSNLAVALERLGKYHEALSVTEEALQRASGLYHSHSLMAINHNRALLFTHLGEYEKAIESLKESAFWAEQMRLVRALSFIYNTKGVFSFELGKYRDALEDLKKAYENVVKTDDIRQKASILANMGFARTKLGYWEEAEKDLVESITLRKKLNDRKGLSNNLFYLGELMRQWEKFQKAEEHFVESISIKEEINDKMGLLYALGYFSMLYSDKGEFDEAFKIAKKGLKVADSINDPHGTLFLEVALLYAIMGLAKFTEFEDSIAALKSKLSNNQYFHLEGIVYYLDGQYREKRKEPEHALSSYLKALEKSEITGEIKLKARSVEKILNLMVSHGLGKFGLDRIVTDAEEVLNFYEEKGFKRKAKNLSLILSEL